MIVARSSCIRNGWGFLKTETLLYGFTVPKSLEPCHNKTHQFATLSSFTVKYLIQQTSYLRYLYVCCVEALEGSSRHPLAAPEVTSRFENAHAARAKALVAACLLDI